MPEAKHNDADRKRSRVRARGTSSLPEQSKGDRRERARAEGRRHPADNQRASKLRLAQRRGQPRAEAERRLMESSRATASGTKKMTARASKPVTSFELGPDRRRSRTGVAPQEKQGVVDMFR